MAKINGTELAEVILADLNLRVKKLQLKQITPHLVVLLIGEDPASVTYVNQKKLRGEDINIKITVDSLPETITTDQLLNKIKLLNDDNTVHGIIIQRPVPKHIDKVELDYAVDTEKDVDAFHPESLFTPPVALAIQRILEYIHTQVNISQSFLSWLGKQKITVMGKGEAGGKPIMQLFDTLGISYKVIDSKTQHPENHLRKSDIVISAVGKSDVITKDLLKKDVILIGIGLSKNDGQLKGDYLEEDIEEVASFYTPSPKGVGPVNVAMLLSNLVSAAENLSE